MISRQPLRRHRRSLPPVLETKTGSQQRAPSFIRENRSRSRPGSSAQLRGIGTASLTPIRNDGGSRNVSPAPNQSHTSLVVTSATSQFNVDMQDPSPKAGPTNMTADSIPVTPTDEPKGPCPLEALQVPPRIPPDENVLKSGVPTRKPACALRAHGYIKDKLLGSGTYGKVFMVHNKSGQKFACKEIDMNRASATDARNLFKEGSLLGKLQHPYIVEHVAHFTENGFLFLVLEYCSGGDLASRIGYSKREQQLIPEQQVLVWLFHALSALDYMHGQHVLHRDLKPQNLFITRSSKLKIGDLGIAKLLENTVAVARTQIGTPFYVSPELCKGRPYAWPSDIWAMGCIVFETCAQKPPFDGPNMISLVNQICTGVVPDLPSEYSNQMHQLCKQLLAKNPKDRPSAGDVLVQPELQTVQEQQLLVKAGEESEDPLAEENHEISMADEKEDSLEQHTFCFDPTQEHSVSLPSEIKNDKENIGKHARTVPHLYCDLARTIVTSTQTNQTMTAQGEELMRRLYLKCVQVNPGHILQELAAPLREELLGTSEGAHLMQGEPKSVNVAIGSSSIATMDKQVFCVGRADFCDIVTPQSDKYTSRIHLVVFNLPGGLIVVDGWSCAGTSVSTWGLAAERGLPQSKPGERCAFMVPHNEPTVLQIGANALLLNPKACIVCVEKSRSLCLPCGHQATCAKCAMDCDKYICPICRTTFQPSSAKERFAACVGATYAGGDV